MLFEAFDNLISLDFGWFVQVILLNIFWVFALLAVTYFYWGKRALSGFLAITFTLWALSDFTHITGWAWAIGVFLLFHYLTRMAIMIFAADIKTWEPHLPKIYAIQFLILLVFFNVFIW